MQLFASAAFARLVLVPMFNAGETIFVQQTRGGGAVEGVLSLSSVWLSASADPADTDASLVNLTDKVTVLPSPNSSVRFSFVAAACKDCILHVMSSVSPGTNTSYSHSSTLFQALSPLQDATREIKGTLFLIALQAESFITDPLAQSALVAAIRAVVQLPSETVVAVGLALFAVEPAPGGAQAVRATYSIVVPVDGLEDGRSADSVARSLQSVSVADMQSTVQRALKDIAGESRHIVTVTEVTQRVELELPTSDLEGKDLTLPVVLLAVACLVLCACAASALGLLPRRRRAGGAASDRSPMSTAPVGRNSGICMDIEGVAWTLSETLDGAVLACMEKLFNPALDTSGRGRAPQLLIRRVWVVDALALREDYDTAKRRVKVELQEIQPAGALDVGQRASTRTLADAVSAQLNLDESCNEKLLLHGTTPKRVRAILRDGVDERNTAFGHGAYLVEDPSKSYEEAQADTPDAEDEETRRLHETLYKGGTHPGDVFYTFACQVLLGCPVYTQGPASCPVSAGTSQCFCPAGMQVFVDGSHRRLVNVPGAAFPFHSLVVEKGGVPQREREFVVFDRKTVLPKYLVAYGCRESL